MIFMSRWGPDRTELDRSLARRAERDRVRRRLRTLTTAEVGAEAELARRSARLHDEAADVEALESITLTRLLAAVRGTRMGELDRERAEAQKAAYAVRTAREDLDRLRHERLRLTHELDALGDVDAQHERVVRGYATAVALRGGPHTAELDAIADDLAELPLRRVEITQALLAGQRAAGSLAEAAKELSTAHAWSGYDTWLGGGMLSSMIKHDRIDSATDQIGRARFLLGLFRTELADVSIEAPRGIHVSETLGTMDTWFDNIFSDLMVDARIRTARAGIEDSRRAVDDALARLTRMENDLDWRRAQLLQRRDELLGIPPYGTED